MLRIRTELSGWNGGPGLMTHYFLTPLQDVASAIRVSGHVRAVTAARLASQWGSDLTAQIQTEVSVLDAATGNVTGAVSIPPPAAVVGTGGTSYLPPEAALLLNLRTETYLNSHRVRGRIFVSPLSLGTRGDDGTPTDTAQTQMNLFGTDLLGALDAGDTWVVWHRPKLGVGGAAVAISSVNCPNKFAGLRSRRD